MKLAFILTMPSNNSWNGKWTGEGKLYARVRDIDVKTGNYRYSFGDGWVANVEVKKVSEKEAKSINKNSCGFCGYEWMIDSLAMRGKITTD